MSMSFLTMSQVVFCGELFGVDWGDVRHEGSRCVCAEAFFELTGEFYSF